jgi:serralysin
MATGDIRIDALLIAGELKRVDLNPDTQTTETSFSFVLNSQENGFVPLNQVQQEGARQAFKRWEEVADIKITEAAPGTEGVIKLGTAILSAGSAVTNSSGGESVYIWLNNTVDTNLDQTSGSFGFSTMLHEIGHVLGLKHTGNFDAISGGTEGPYLPLDQDNYQYTLMSYNQNFTGQIPYTGSSINPQTPLLYDILAVQHLYGENKTVRTGNDVYRWEPDQGIHSTIWDAGGNDTIDASNQTHRVVLNLEAGSFSSIGFKPNQEIKDNLAIAYKVTIENAIGSTEDDAITGNEANNSLQGAGGSDTLSGGTGADTFVFTSATDGADTIQDFNRQEGDKIRFDAPAQVGQFKYDAGTGALSFDGQAFVTLANKPSFDPATDLVLSQNTQPVPPVVPPPAPPPVAPTITQTVPPPVVPPVAPPSSSLVGTEGDDQLVSQSDQGITIQGLGGNDRITGGAGNDIIDGGAGNDTMAGGLGDDSYTVDSSTDVVIEAINAGNDTVSASASYTLGDNIENLTLTGSDAINGTGNGLNNIMTGNAANNYLYAGDGNDQVNGLAGDDYLYGEAGDDLLNGGEGQDWMVGDLGDDVLSGGVGNDRVLGGAGNDILAGEQGRNRLTGGADADQFVLNALDQNFDIITDFKAAQGDRITVSVKGMAGQMKRGKLTADQFTLGASAQQDQAGFVYNATSGNLFFDADGMGGQKQVQIAKLAARTAQYHGDCLTRSYSQLDI